jgi:hypothetical protein
MNTNLHARGDTLPWNLGLARIAKSFTAEYALKALRIHLLEFGIILETDIIAMVVDGASVMLKLGRLSPVEIQGCTYSAWCSSGCSENFVHNKTG